MRNDKWVDRWTVESSSGGGSYIIGRDAQGNWGCSCRGWTSHVPRRDCKHIIDVKGGGGRTLVESVIDRMAGRA